MADGPMYVASVFIVLTLLLFPIRRLLPLRLRAPEGVVERLAPRGSTPAARAALTAVTMGGPLAEGLGRRGDLGLDVGHHRRLIKAARSLSSVLGSGLASSRSSSFAATMQQAATNSERFMDLAAPLPRVDAMVKMCADSVLLSFRLPMRNSASWGVSPLKYSKCSSWRHLLNAGSSCSVEDKYVDPWFASNECERCGTRFHLTEDAKCISIHIIILRIRMPPKRVAATLLNTLCVEEGEA
jgi:hypothetical protein